MPNTPGALGGPAVIVLYILLGIVGVIVVALALAASCYVATNNRLMALQARCDTAYADIDVQLKQRTDLIPNIVASVRGFADHEKAIVLGVHEARAEALAALNPAMRLNAEKKLTQNITALLNVASSNPDIKASSHFTALRQELIDCENRIAAARRFFNLTVEEYNATFNQFPGSYIARAKRLTTRTAYDLGIERVMLDEPVAISF